ncbi:MAG: hypothetical protein HYX75_10895 [Acidobacteria bacterium]|nr:hypothetical protein [Acidobacteriota bacterium]
MMHVGTTGRIVRDVLSMGGGRLVAVCLSVVQVVYLTRWLSLTEYGLCASMAVLGVGGLMLAAIGARIGNELTATLARETPDDASVRNRRLFLATFVVLASAAALLIVSILLIDDFLPWQALIKTGDERLLREAKTGVMVGLVGQIAALPFGLAVFGFRAYHENEVVAAQTVLSALVTLVMLILARLAPRPLVLAMAAPFLANLLISVVMFAGFVRRRRWPLRPIGDPWQEVQAHATGSGLFALLGASFAFLTYTLPYAVSLTQGFAVAGAIDVYLKLFAIVLLVEGDMLAPLWPAYVAHREIDAWPWIRRSLRISLAMAGGMAAAASFGIWLLGPHVVHYLTGLNLPLSSGTYAGLAIYTLLYSLTLALSTFLNASDLVGIQAAATAAGALCMLWLSVTLGRVYGPSGAIVGVGIAMGLILSVLVARTMVELGAHRHAAGKLSCDDAASV